MDGPVLDRELDGSLLPFVEPLWMTFAVGGSFSFFFLRKNLNALEAVWKMSMARWGSCKLEIKASAEEHQQNSVGEIMAP